MCLSAVRKWDNLVPGPWTGAFISVIEVGLVMNPDRFKDWGLICTAGSDGELKKILFFYSCSEKKTILRQIICDIMFTLTLSRNTIHNFECIQII